MSKINALARVLNQKVMDFQWMDNLNMTAYNILVQTIKKIYICHLTYLKSVCSRNLPEMGIFLILDFF